MRYDVGHHSDYRKSTKNSGLWQYLRLTNYYILSDYHGLLNTSTLLPVRDCT